MNAQVQSILDQTFEVEICQSCFQLIDIETCHCGDLIDDHSIGGGHTAVPLGCRCGYNSFKSPPKHLIGYIRSLTSDQETELSGFLETNSVMLDAEMVSNIRVIGKKR